MDESKRPPIVLDTNVLVVAELADRSEECVADCLATIKRIREGLRVAVDDGDLIVTEYATALKGLGTSGVGVKLALRLRHLCHDPDVCTRVTLTPVEGPPPTFEEVPEPLRDFDNDDQKFLAVAAGHPSLPQIFTAVDTEWWQRRREFVDCGIDVQFACAQEFL